MTPKYFKKMRCTIFGTYGEIEKWTIFNILIRHWHYENIDVEEIVGINSKIKIQVFCQIVAWGPVEQ